MAADYSQWASRIRVPAGFVNAAIYLVAAEPQPRMLLTGCVIALAGLAVRAWAAGVIEKNTRLAISGPYAYTRNPLYLGSTIAAVGFAIAAGKWWLLVMMAGFFVAVYIPVIRREQAHLTELFGSDYAAYCASVPLLRPRPTPWRPAGTTANAFSWRRYWKNHEYRAAAAFALIVTFLTVKMLWAR